MDWTASPNIGNTQDNNPQSTHHHKEVRICDIEIGSNEYYDLIADQYGHDSEDQACRTWMQAVLDKHKDWIGLTVTPEGDTKVLDYRAGTGFMSHALAPYVNKIIGMDLPKNMTVQYVKIVEQTLDDYSNCLKISVRGDMIHPNPDAIDIPSDYMPFDIVAMCLGVDFFAPDAALHHDVPNLTRALASLTSYMAQGGTLVLLEIEKEYEAGDEHDGEDDDYEAKRQDSMSSSKKSVSYGSREICTALEALGMEDIEVKGDLWFKDSSKGGQICFLLKARKGDKYHEPAAENVQA